jgi:hypothetical protein
VICDRLLQAVPPPDRDEVYWIEATKVEALFGSGRRDEAEQLQSQIIARQEERARSGDQVTAYDPTGWMEESLANQIDKLAKLLP